MVFSLKCPRGTKILNHYDVELVTVINIYTKRTENKQSVTSIFRKKSMNELEDCRRLFLTLAVSKVGVQFLTTVKNLIIWNITQYWGKKLTRLSQSKTLFEYSTCQRSQ